MDSQEEVNLLRWQLQQLDEEYQKLKEHVTNIENTYFTSVKNVEDEQNWGLSSPLLSLVTELFNNQLYSDISIHLDGGHSIYGHKLILASKSDEWGDLQNMDKLDLSDLSYDVAYAAIKWVYTEELNIKGDDEDLIKELLKCSVQFRLDYLYLKCQKFLTTRINISNCKELYDLAEETSAHILKECCMKLLMKSSDINYVPDTDIIDANITNPLISDQSKKDDQLHQVTANLKNRCPLVKEKKHECSYCGQKFVTAKNCRSHELIHTGQKPYACDICGKRFRYKSVIKRHIRTHTGEKPYKCDYCQKSFNQSSHLLQHTKIHTGYKPFKCDYCEKTFIERGPLRLHMRIHTQEKPFACHICQQSFARKTSLQDHLNKHAGLKPFKCGTCNKEFCKKLVLKQHMLSHTTEKPYKCDICDRAFASRYNIKKHMKTHTDELKYQCEVCNKTFSSKTSYEGHIMIHNGTSPYHCEICEKDFIIKSSLSRHNKKYHSNTS